MNPEATLEIVRALSEGRLTRSNSALYRSRPTVIKMVEIKPPDQSWKDLIEHLKSVGKIHVLAETNLSRIENKRKVMGY